MGLQEKLNELKRLFLASGRASPEMRSIMHRSTEELRNSGILERALKAGQQAPAFELPNQDGQFVSSTALLAGGPVIVSFFRGVW
jgi:cytochrome oxidase Cu insertion factor (SCO1/SenC/PrrC family)